MQEALQVRSTLLETRNAREVLYTNTQGGFINIQAAIIDMNDAQQKAWVALEQSVSDALCLALDAARARVTLPGREATRP